MRARVISRIVAGLLVVASPAVRAADLRIAVGTPIASVDPLFFQGAADQAFSVEIFDMLVDRDPTNNLKPGLALSWKPLDNTTWEFKLRPGVKFHDGTPFTADDVIATIARTPNVANSPGSYATAVAMIASVTAPDPLTVIMKTKGPAPFLPLQMSLIAMLRKSHIDEPTANYNNGKAAIGTGPYKFERYVPDDQTIIRANENYWGGKPAWDKVTYRTITNDAARVSALLSGGVDIIDKVPTEMLASLQANPAFKVIGAPTPALIWLAMDQFRDQSPFVTTKDGKPLDKNPLKDVRVRRALSMAIDRELLLKSVFSGQGVVGSDIVPPTSPASTKRPQQAVDIEGAKRLLAEAGYPDGFGLTIHAPPDRYYGAERVVQAVASMFNRIGVNTRVEMVLWANYLRRMSDGTYSMSMVSRGLSSDPTEVLTNGLVTQAPDRSTGQSNPGRFSDPKVDALAKEALLTLDDDKRNDLIRQAGSAALDQQAILPLYFFNNIWAARSDLQFEVYANNYIRPIFIKKK